MFVYVNSSERKNGKMGPGVIVAINPRFIEAVEDSDKENVVRVLMNSGGEVSLWVNFKDFMNSIENALKDNP